MAKTKQKQAQQKPQGQCIFCQGHGMTKQHIWPNWMSHADIPYRQEALAATANHQLLYGSRLIFDTSKTNNELIVHQPNVINRKGSILTRKLRMVCQKCNNQWMSVIEDKSKNIILELQSHKPTVLSESEQYDLAAWITLMTIICEFTDIPTKVIPFNERKYFFDNKVAPSHWHIWIGKYQGDEWKFRYRHTGARMVLAGENEGQPQEIVSEESWQSSTFVVGGLIMHVISVDSVQLQDYFSGFDFPSMVKIFPAISNPINWNSLPINSDTNAMSISQYVENHMRDFSIEVGKAIRE